MFSDTHFHFKLMTEEYGINGVEVLETMADRNCYFGLDIGTRSEDLQPRIAAVEKAVQKIPDEQKRKKIDAFMHYTAGIWPDVAAIHNRVKCMDELEKNINEYGKVLAIGECGLDHHWNPAGADGRKEEDFDKETFYGEKELFLMQLELAKKLFLPVVVHSREAFGDTVECINEAGYNNGIIHCYSYGLEEARKFLDMGWYIALGGAVTYTKKSKMEDMLRLINYIPQERLLLETDAPYLTPVPLRGTPNSPVKIENTYEFISKARNMSVNDLCSLTDENIKRLFNGN